MDAPLESNGETPEERPAPESRPQPRAPGAWSAWLNRLALVALAPAALAIQRRAEAAPDTVELVYSRTIYPDLAAVLSCVTSLIPWSVAEALLALVLLAVALRVVRLVGQVRRGASSLLGGLLGFAGDLAAGLAVAYAAYLLLWGLNHHRQPFAETARLTLAPAPAAELELLAVELVEEANQQRGPLEEDAAGVLRLPLGLRATLDRTALGFALAAERHPVLAGLCARPKPALVSPLLSRLELAGIYSPFTGEANVNATLPPPELPFAAAHEVAHQRGFAREDEANYLAYLACRRHPDGVFRYSAALAAGGYVLAAVAESDREAFGRVSERRSAPVRRDLAAIEAWRERYRSPVAAAVSERVNDAYLRSQGEQRGVRSYGRMVDLLLAERRARLAEPRR